MSDPTTSAALALRDRTEPSPYEPKNYEQAVSMANMFAKATRRPPEEVFLKMAAAAALKIDVVSALQSIDVLEGPNGLVPAYRARLLVAMCLGSALCDYFECVESDATHATWRAKRAGRPERVLTYRIEDAQRARLVKSGGAYEKDPESQLNARASARLARLVFPDVVLNMSTREELEEAAATADIPAPVEPLPEAKPAAVVDAEFTEVDDEQRVIRLFDGATSAAAVAEIAKEALALWPSGRPEMVRTAYAAAKARTAPRERQPGEEG